MKDLKSSTPKPFADFEGPVKNFAQNFGDPWIRKVSAPPTHSNNFVPEKSANLLLPPIVANTDFGGDENFQNSDPFSVGSQSKNPKTDPENPIPSMDTVDPANPISGSRFPNFPVKGSSGVAENPGHVSQLWSNPGLDANPVSMDPATIHNLNSNPDFFNNFEFANPSLNNWKRATLNDKTTSEDNPYLDDPILDDPLLDDPLLNDPLLDDPELDEILLKDPKLVNQLLSEEPVGGQGPVNSKPNLLGLRSSTAILKQNIMELDRALLNLQKPQVSHEGLL